MNGKEFLLYQNELEVVFSLMTDAQLMQLKDRIEEIINEKVYEEKEFPLSCAELRFLQATIMFSFWVRKGKGVRIEEGEIVVCELKDSPFWQRYQAPDIYKNEERGEFYLDNPEHERDQMVEKTEEERGEFV
jgi:hypothetical protein